jgi:hypothetical protein
MIVGQFRRTAIDRVSDVWLTVNLPAATTATIARKGRKHTMSSRNHSGGADGTVAAAPAGNR